MLGRLAASAEWLSIGTLQQQCACRERPLTDCCTISAAAILRRHVCLAYKMTDQSVILRMPWPRSDRASQARRTPAIIAGDHRQGARAERRVERRDAILAAALEEFSARGFAATRLDDVANRAGVAKGTIYLYFRDKESAVPGTGALDAHPVGEQDRGGAGGRSAGQGHRGDDRRPVRPRDLWHTPQGRDPPHHCRGAAISQARGVLLPRSDCPRAGGDARACSTARSKTANSATTRLRGFPQLLVAPALVAVVWNGLFERFAPLDVRELMRAHLDLLFGERRAT